MLVEPAYSLFSLLILAVVLVELLFVYNGRKFAESIDDIPVHLHDFLLLPLVVDGVAGDLDVGMGLVGSFADPRLDSLFGVAAVSAVDEHDLVD